MKTNCELLRGLRGDPKLRRRFLKGLFIIEREAKARQEIEKKK